MTNHCSGHANRRRELETRFDGIRRNRSRHSGLWRHRFVHQLYEDRIESFKLFHVRRNHGIGHSRNHSISHAVYERKLRNHRQQFYIFSFFKRLCRRDRNCFLHGQCHRRIFHQFLPSSFFAPFENPSISRRIRDCLSDWNFHSTNFGKIYKLGPGVRNWPMLSFIESIKFVCSFKNDQMFIKDNNHRGSNFLFIRFPF